MGRREQPVGAGPMPLSPTDPGQVGPIAITARLGAGAMGHVYLGRTAAGKPVAVKIARPELAADPVFRTRFRREVAALRDISGSHGAGLIDGDICADRPWLATTYIPAVPLAEAVDDFGPLPEPVVRQLAWGILRALHAIHAAGIVHRDLKPSNVLLTADGVQVIDFGIAATVEGTVLTATGVHLGSAAYMAPEQATEGRVGPAADMFSLGCLLCYALTGAPPFGEGRAHAVLYRIAHEEPGLSQVDAATGDDHNLNALIRQCLAKNPDDRPTPGELLDTEPECAPGPGWLPPALADRIDGYAATTDRYFAEFGTSAAAPTERFAPPRSPDVRRSGRHRVAVRRPSRRPPRRGVVLRAGVVALVLVAAATGVVWRATVGSASGTPSTPPPWLAGVAADLSQHGMTQPGGPLFTAVGGPGCAPPATVTVNPFDGGGRNGNWHPASTSGFTGAGCTGSFLYSHVANAQGRWHNDYDWTFHTGLADPSCLLSFYVPVSRFASDTSVYAWRNDTGDFADPHRGLGGFTLDQADHHGEWLTVGPYTFPGGIVGVELTDLGQGPTRTVTAAPLRVTC